MEGSLCFFLGDATSPNVRRLVEGLTQMLPREWPITFLVADIDPFSELAHDNHTFLETAGIRALDRVLTQRKPAVLVQLTDPPVHGTICTLLSRRHGVPAVYRYSGDRFHEYRVANGTQRARAFIVGNLLNRPAVRLANRYIALGPIGAARLRDRGVAADQISILPPAVDTAMFTPEGPVADLGVSVDRPVVLFVGRLTHLKGQATLERTIPDLLSRRDDLQFVFVGDKGHSLDVSTQYREHISFMGEVPPEDIPRYMRRADLLVHPSLTEGVPRVLLESLAAGTPVIARDVGDVATVTENTFETDERFIELIEGFEDLPLDSVDQFSLTSLGPAYQTFFEQFLE